MNKRLRAIESKILLYFSMVSNGCRNYVDDCDHSPYYCGYSEASKREINTYEICLFVTGVVKCQGEIEKHFIDKHNKSSFRTTLRAIQSLEKKGFIEKGPIPDDQGKPVSRWLMTYKLMDH